MCRNLINQEKAYKLLNTCQNSDVDTATVRKYENDIMAYDVELKALIKQYCEEN